MSTSTYRIAGVAVHVFTASGAVCALLATLAVLNGHYERCFAWLLLALLIDAIDGTFARAVDVKKNLPRISGERLDLVIDYVTYVFVPVLALIRGGFLSGYSGHAVAGLVLLSSLFHFSDLESKAGDNCFVGFPAVWNLVAFCIFAWGLPPLWAGVLSTTLALLTFVPMHWLHPMRVRRLMLFNVAIALLGLAAAVWAMAAGFPSPLVPKALLALSALYFSVLAIVWPR
ncbi:MAG: phosphatidylcholine synthase [Proteobacteria bacterium]|nr:phosphatidylcholine synthase [Pseudomonadota bacterium]